MSMNGSYLLDTNIIIALFAIDSDVIRQLADASRTFVPVIVLGELYYGASKSAHAKNNTAHINNFAIKSTVLACDTDTARHYGRIKDQLRSKGSPIPENDIWIAALAKQHHLTLATRDQHFKSVKDLTLAQW